jgi:hypothetical protein
LERKLFDFSGCSRVQRKHAAQRRPAGNSSKTGKNFFQGLLVIHVEISVDGGEKEAAGHEAVFVQYVLPVEERFHHLEHIEHDIPYNVHTFANIFLPEIRRRGVGTTKEQLRHVIREHPVDFLGHVLRCLADPRLYVRERNSKFCRRERPRKRGVRIAIDKYKVWSLGDEQFLEADKDISGLFAVRCGTNAELKI